MADKEKIAILGAGPAGLAAAWGLSATQAQRDRHEITIYQVGWRAGGKCGSGREGPESKIAQNGTHYLFGCYDNTLGVAREAYAELKAAGVTDFGEFESALLPRDLLALKHVYRGKWRLWPIPLPGNRAMPGERQGYLSAPEYFCMFLQSILCLILGIRLGRALRPGTPFDEDRPPLLRAVYAVLGPPVGALGWLFGLLGVGLFRAAVRLLRALGDPDFLSVARLLSGLRTVNGWLFSGLAGRFAPVYRFYTSMDFACTAGMGLLRDRVPALGLRAIEPEEFTAWLARHGASETTLKAPFASTWYDAVAAFEDGDPDRPNLSAGVSMMAIGKALMTYKGHFAFQMRSEVGDTFVGPVCEVLRRRGVKFRFFHKVLDVVPDEDGGIAEIVVERQVAMRSGDPESYDPFTVVDGFRVWPNAPRWDQIEQAPPDPYVDISSFYTTWRGETLPPLRRGADFDRVVMALPVASLPTYCAGLLDRSQAWRDMTDHMTGVETQTMRLYFTEDLEGMGWDLPTPILSNYAMPFATWEDNGHLVEVETWPEDRTPRAIATLFGPLPAPRVSPPPTATGYPAEQAAAVEANTLKFLEQHIGALWPGVASPEQPDAIDWTKLVDLGFGFGPARLQAQYLSANCGPLERYTTAKAGTAQHRLASDKSGFDNMVLAGDWTLNGYLIGSVEGAIMSGLQASRALSGHPATIPGEDTGL